MASFRRTHAGARRSDPAPPHGVSVAVVHGVRARVPGGIPSLAHTEDACTRGLEVLDSQATLSMARKALPPEDCYFHLDAELVRAGVAKIRRC